MRCRGHPLPWGFKGRAALGPAQRTKNPLPKASISALRASLFGSSWPQKGPKSQRQKGTPESHGWRGFGLPNVISQDYPVVSEDYIARQGMTQKRFVKWTRKRAS